MPSASPSKFDISLWTEFCPSLLFRVSINIVVALRNLLESLPENEHDASVSTYLCKRMTEQMSFSFSCGFVHSSHSPLGKEDISLPICARFLLLCTLFKVTAAKETRQGRINILLPFFLTPFACRWFPFLSFQLDFRVLCQNDSRKWRSALKLLEILAASKEP